MGDLNPTIIAANLDTNQLENSIKDIVSKVEDATKVIASSFDGMVANANKKLSEIGSVKTNNFIVEKTKEIDEAAKNTTVTLDKMSTAIKNSTKTKSSPAEESYIAILKNMRENAALLAMEIKDMPNWTLNKQIESHERYEKQIAQTKKKVEELKAQLQELAKEPNSSRLASKQILEEIALQQKKINELEKEQILATQKISKEDNQLLAQKQAQYEKQKQDLIALSVGTAEKAKFTRDEAEAEQRKAAEIERENQLIKEQEELKRKAAEADEKRRKKEYQTRLTATGSMDDSSIPSAERKLRKLLELKNELRKDPLLDIAKMEQLDKRILRTIEKLRKLREIAKPQPILSMEYVSKMSEKTVDELQRKIQAINQLRGMSAVGSPELRLLNAEYGRLNNTLQEALDKNNKYIASNNGLARSFGYIRNRIVYALTIGAVTNFTKQIYEVRAQYELLERSLGVLVDSFENGSEIFRELNQMALKSPFTLMELGGAAKQLTAYNFAAKEVVNTTRRLADISAALGVPMERLTYNLGQIRAQTVLTSRDARDFANAGLPIVKSLADYYSELQGRVVSTGDVFDMMKKKAVSYNDVMAVLNKMTDEGGKFFDFQAKQAETLKVQLANLSLAWNNLLNDIGKSNQDLLSLPLKALRELFNHWEELSRVITTLTVTYGVFKARQMLTIAMLGKETIETVKNMAAIEGKTAAEYESALATKNLTAQQAKLLIALNKNNVALKQAIVNMGILSQKQVQAAATSGKLTANVAMASWSMKSLWTGAINGIKSFTLLLKSNVWLFAIGALLDLMNYSNKVSENVKQFNKEVSESANEAAKSIEKYLNVVKKSNVKDRLPSMSRDELSKAWDALREEIEKSSAASDVFIKQLMQEDDLIVRISKGIDIAEKIESASKKLGDLNKELKVTEDGWLYGLFGGEGFKTDLADAVNQLNRFRGDFASGWDEYWNANDIGDLPQLRTKLNDFENELDVTSDRIVELFRKKGIRGREEITDALNRIKQTIIKNQDLSDQAAKLFSFEFDVKMERRFEGMYDRTTTVWNTIMEYIQRESSSAFQNITDEVLDNTHIWSKEQQEAIQKAIDKARRDLPPEAKSIFDQIQADFNSREWKINITTAFDTKVRTDLQKLYDKTFMGSGEANPNYAYYSEFSPKDEEDVASYRKRLNEQLKKDTEQQINLQNQANASRAKGTEEAKKFADITAGEAQKLKDSNKIIDEIKKKLNLLDEPTKGRGGSKSDPFGDALKKEIEIITNINKKYKEYRKEGVNAQEAITLATQEYSRTLASTNSTLQRYGIKSTKTGADIAKMDLRDIKAYYQELLKGAQAAGNVKGIEALEKALANLNEEIVKFDMKKVTDSLNSELGKLKEEYEFGIELDANPELGDTFGDILGLDKDKMAQLPRTFAELSKKLQEAINKTFEENDIDATFDLIEMLDKSKFEKWVKDSGHMMEDKFVEALKNVRDYANKIRTDEAKQTVKTWSDLIDKYGDVQSKILKISQNTLKEQIGLIRQFGTDADISESANLLSQINIATDSTEIARLQKELAKILERVTKDNNVAISISTAIQNQGKKGEAKAIWDDFKDSDEYAQMFDRIEYLSVSSLQNIISKLDEVKDKIKEDPASMKAWFEAYKKIQDAIYTLDPARGIGEGFRDIVRGIKDFTSASRTITDTEKDIEPLKEELANIKKELTDAYIELNDAKLGGGTERQVKAQEKVNVLKKKEKDINEKIKKQQDNINNAQKKQVNSRDLIMRGLEKVRYSSEKWSSELGSISDALSAIGNVFSALGDDETAEDINKINMGFTAMISIMEAVTAVLILIKLGFAELYIIAMAVVGLFIGLVALFSSASNKQITRSIEESEKKVRLLENAYKDLEGAIKTAYGAEEYGLRQAEIANKKLQLAELQRQLQLERSRKGKHYDQEKIDEYVGKVKDLENEIADMVRSLTDELLGIESVGNAAEELVNSMIDSFRKGEDYMQEYTDTFADMIDNMIVKAIASRVIGDRLQSVWDMLDSKVASRSQSEKSDIEYYTKQLNEHEYALNSWIAERGNLSYNQYWLESEIARIQAIVNQDKKNLEEAQRAYADAARVTPEDVEDVRAMSQTMKESVKSDFEALMEAFGVKFGEGADAAELSNLQQGISSISEDTAGAIEAYMNGMSQQIYLHSELLTQIRDAVVAFNLDVQLSLQSQMLLQLQNSYQVQMSIQSILQGWSNPSGMAVKVEMV